MGVLVDITPLRVSPDFRRLWSGQAISLVGTTMTTIAAAVTPDELRGRVSGVEIAVYAGGPVLGDVEAGVVGDLISVPFAIVSGGLACVAAAAGFALFVPRLAHYEPSAATVAEP